MTSVTHWFRQERARRWALAPLFGGTWLMAVLGGLFILWLVWPLGQELENE